MCTCWIPQVSGKAAKFFCLVNAIQSLRSFFSLGQNKQSFSGESDHRPPWQAADNSPGAFTMNSMKNAVPLCFISWRKTPNDAMTPQCQSQFTPKMKANAVPPLLSSLVWIDPYNECNGMTSFMELFEKLSMISSVISLS